MNTKNVGTVMMTIAVLFLGVTSFSILLSGGEGESSTETLDESIPVNEEVEGDQTDTNVISPTLKIAPTAIVMVAELAAPNARTYVAAPVAPLTIRADPDLKEPIEIFYPPLFSPDGSGKLLVSPAENCEVLQTESDTGEMEQEQGNGLHCLKVTVEEGFNPGTYSSEISVSAGTEQETVPVDIYVGLQLWWPLMTIALGVIVTEILVRWARYGRYSTGWKNLRAKWIDLLTEDEDWIEIFYQHDVSHKDDANQAVLQIVKKELLGEVKKLNDWLANGQKGEVKIGQLPDSEAAAREKVFTLSRIMDRYLVLNQDNDLYQKLKDVEENLMVIGSTALNAGKTKLKNNKEKVDDLYRKKKGKEGTFESIVINEYQALLDLQQGTDPLTNEKLKAIWETIEPAMDDGKLLQKAYLAGLDDQLLKPTTLFGMEELTKSLLTNLNSLNDKLVKVAKKELVTIAQVKAGDQKTIKDKDKVMKLLTAITGLAPTVESVLLEINMLYQPMSKLLLKEVEIVESDVNAFKGLVEKLGIVDLREDAIKGTMLKQIQKNLQSADAKMAVPQDDLAAVWKGLDLSYQQDRHFIKLGQRAHDDYSENSEAAKRAYQFLLEGDPLAAEIELERAEPTIGLPTNIQMTLEKGRDRGIRRLLSSTPARIIYVIVLLLSIDYISELFPRQGLALSQGSNLLGFLLTILIVIAIIIILLSIVWKKTWFKALRGEVAENGIPWIRSAVGRLVYQLLTITVAVAIIAFAYDLFDSTKPWSWGTFPDFVIAFTWGALVNRLAEPASSGWESLAEFLKPGAKSEEAEADSTETPEEGKEK